MNPIPDNLGPNPSYESYNPMNPLPRFARNDTFSSPPASYESYHPINPIPNNLPKSYQS